MAVTGTLYNNYKNLALKGSVAILTDTIKGILLTPSYTPNIDTDIFLSDINTNEVTGAGYSAGGVAVTSPTVTTDTVNDRGVFGCATISFPSVTIASFRYLALYKSTGVAGTSALIGYIDFGTNQSSGGGTVSIAPSASGMFYLG